MFFWKIEKKKYNFLEPKSANIYKIKNLKIWLFLLYKSLKVQIATSFFF